MAASSWILVFLIVLLRALREVSCQGYEPNESSDIYCLQQFKESVGDPENSLASWTFYSISPENICQEFVGVQCFKPSQISVYVLELSDMRLQGTFPQGLENCTGLTALNLSFNAFTGPIPSDIGQKLPFLVKLDLSSNSLGGGIPNSLSNCTYLNFLNLQRNRLTGSIPGEIGALTRLTDVDFSDNQLTGSIPDNFRRYPASDFQGNSGLRGYSPLSTSRSSISSDDSDAGLIIGSVVGWCAGFYGSVIWYFLVKKSSRKCSENT